MSKHTPGPYLYALKLDGDRYEDLLWSNARPNPHIAIINSAHPDARGNANLFAAAPDLYAACKEALQYSEDSEGGGYRVLNEMLRAAIAKAEGGAQ